MSVLSAGSDRSKPPKGRKRLRLVLDLASAPGPPDLVCRVAELSDKEPLAALMLDAYRGTIDYDGESLDDALREIGQVYSGSYGRFLPDCSFVVSAEAELSSACLVALLDEGKPDETPLLAFVMTRKQDQRRGLASALILRSAAALSGLGYSRLSLAVTAANVPARRLYDRLGFRLAQHGTDGQFWTAATSPNDVNAGATAGSERPKDVTLREVVDADLPIFFEQEQDPEAIYMAAFTPKDPADQVAFLAHWARIRGDKGITIRTVLHKGQVAGSVASYGPTGEPEVTYWLGREYWGMGVATQALREFLKLVTVRPLYARAAKDNLASLRVLAKCGFRVSSEGRGFANARGKEIEELVLRLEYEEEIQT